MYLAGLSLREIARRLNERGVPCPSAHRPQQNRHRRQDGWQVSTLSTILSNPRYTGYEVFGKARKVEELVDSTDVSLGYRTKFRRNPHDAVVRSRHPAHEALVSVETFVAVQRIQAVDRLKTPRERAAQDRTRVGQRKPFALRGRVRCALCGRKMEVAPRRSVVYLCCRSRDLVPSSSVVSHPGHIYLRQDSFSLGLHAWLASVFSLERRADTLAMLVESSVRAEEPPARTGSETRQLLEDAEVRLRRLQAAIEAGADPAAVVEPINRAQVAVANLRADLALARSDDSKRSPVGSALELSAVLDEFDDVAREVFGEADEAELIAFYDALGLAVTYDHQTGMADATVQLAAPSRGPNVRVRGGT